jgi:hypothetical protein
MFLNIEYIVPIYIAADISKDLSLLYSVYTNFYIDNKNKKRASIIVLASHYNLYKYKHQR